MVHGLGSMIHFLDYGPAMFFLTALAIIARASPRNGCNQFMVILDY